MPRQEERATRDGRQDWAKSCFLATPRMLPSHTDGRAHQQASVVRVRDRRSLEQSQEATVARVACHQPLAQADVLCRALRVHSPMSRCMARCRAPSKHGLTSLCSLVCVGFALDPAVRILPPASSRLRFLHGCPLLPYLSPSCTFILPPTGPPPPLPVAQPRTRSLSVRGRQAEGSMGAASRSTPRKRRLHSSPVDLSKPTEMSGSPSVQLALRRINCPSCASSTSIATLGDDGGMHTGVAAGSVHRDDGGSHLE